MIRIIVSDENQWHGADVKSAISVGYQINQNQSALLIPLEESYFGGRYYLGVWARNRSDSEVEASSLSGKIFLRM